MGARRIRREQRRFDMNLSRQTNGTLKEAERGRRAQRMLGIIAKNKFPYLPAVMSWLSAELEKPARLIVQADVEKVVAAHKS